MLKPGDSAKASFVATDRDMASSLSVSEEDSFPEVFATSRMIALMELAGARLMKRILAAQQLSVGVGVCIKHLAATPNDTHVSAVATFLEMEGKLFKFRVEAFDPAGKIGEGEHTRAVIDADRLINGAKKRMAGVVSGQ
jgi:predicted thioesterase